jgi:hypothetical protein
MVLKTLPAGPSTQYWARYCGQIRSHAHAPLGAVANPAPSERTANAIRELLKIVNIVASSPVSQAWALILPPDTVKSAAAAIKPVRMACSSAR